GDVPPVCGQQAASRTLTSERSIPAPSSRKREAYASRRMSSEPRRTQGHLSWEWIDRRLGGMGAIRGATARPGGRADGGPVWFWWDGEQIYFSTKAESRKARNLRRRPNLVLHNGDGADPIIVKGEAVPVDDEAELARIDRAYAEKYVAPESGERATVFVRGDVRLRVRPRRGIGWEYGNVSYRTDWEFD